MTFWDWTAGLYDFFERFNRNYKVMIKKVCEITPQDATVLELAAGTGNISLSVSNKAKSVLCTDISNSMLKVAKRKAKNKKNIEFCKINIFKIGHNDNSFDVVIASQVLHLLNEPKKAVEEIKRVAKTMAILPIPLTKQTTPWGGFLIGLYKLFGYKAPHALTFETCKSFLEEIGFNNCEFHFMCGSLPLCVGIWRKNNGMQLCKRGE